MMKLKNLEEALVMFKDATANHANATDKGDYKMANKNYSIITRVINYLKEENKISELSQFLNDPSDGTKGWAAIYLLPFQEKEAICVLEAIASGDGLRSLAAETTLSEWKKGNLKL